MNVRTEDYNNTQQRCGQLKVPLSKALSAPYFMSDNSVVNPDDKDELEPSENSKEDNLQQYGSKRSKRRNRRRDFTPPDRGRPADTITGGTR
jgi:hypothetical protein